MKKLMLGALAALCAMLALPALASAQPLHLHEAPEFTVTGGPSALSRTAGGNTIGTSTTGTGFFENTTTGKVKLLFHHVTVEGAGFNCTSPNQPTGTVVTTELPFHLVTLTNEKPGILITPNTTTHNGVPTEGTTHFADYHCGIFVGTVVVKGTGVLGTITSPECNGSSTKATLKFGGAAGIQEHTHDSTGNHYGLEASVGGGAYSRSAMNAEATINFAGAQTLTCT